MSFSKICWRSAFVRYVAAKPGAAYSLGPGPLLDAIDRRLDRGDGLRREHAGEVVDRPVDLGFGEGRSRWRCVGRRIRVRGRTAGKLAGDLHERPRDGHDRRRIEVAGRDDRADAVGEDPLERFGRDELLELRRCRVRDLRR